MSKSGMFECVMLPAANRDHVETVFLPQQSQIPPLRDDDLHEELHIKEECLSDEEEMEEYDDDFQAFMLSEKLLAQANCQSLVTSGTSDFSSYSSNTSAMLPIANTSNSDQQCQSFNFVPASERHCTTSKLAPTSDKNYSVPKKDLLRKFTAYEKESQMPQNISTVPVPNQNFVQESANTIKFTEVLNSLQGNTTNNEKRKSEEITGNRFPSPEVIMQMATMLTGRNSSSVTCKLVSGPDGPQFIREPVALDKAKLSQNSCKLLNTPNTTVISCSSTPKNSSQPTNQKSKESVTVLEAQKKIVSLKKGFSYYGIAPDNSNSKSDAETISENNSSNSTNGNNSTVNNCVSTNEKEINNGRFEIKSFRQFVDVDNFACKSMPNKSTFDSKSNKITTKFVDETNSRDKDSFLYTCNICGEKLNTQPGANRHLFRHCFIEKYTPSQKCKFCDFVSDSRVNLHLHEVIHDIFKFECPHCSIYLMCQSQLDKHLRISHEDEKNKATEEKTSVNDSHVSAKLKHDEAAQEGSDDNLVTDLSNEELPQEEEEEEEVSQKKQQSQDNKETYQKKNKLSGDCITNPDKDEKNELLLESTHSSPFKFRINHFFCSICNRKFVVKRDLYLHAEVAHKNINLTVPSRASKNTGIHKCPLCTNVSFAILDLYHNHMLAHRGISPYACNICKMQFKTRQRYYTHCHKFHAKWFAAESFAIKMAKKWNELSTSPSIVNMPAAKVSLNSSNHPFTLELPAQENTIKEKLLIICNLCSKTFENISVLYGHCNDVHKSNRINFDECTRPSKGNYNSDCSFASDTRKIVWAHMFQHFDLKPFMCKFCGRTYRHRNSVYWHQTVEHSNKNTACEQYICNFCQQVKPSLKLLRKHIIKKHLQISRKSSLRKSTKTRICSLQVSRKTFGAKLSKSTEISTEKYLKRMQRPTKFASNKDREKSENMVLETSNKSHSNFTVEKIQENRESEPVTTCTEITISEITNNEIKSKNMTSETSDTSRSNVTIEIAQENVSLELKATDTTTMAAENSRPPPVDSDFDWKKWMSLEVRKSARKRKKREFSDYITYDSEDFNEAQIFNTKRKTKEESEATAKDSKQSTPPKRKLNQDNRKSSDFQKEKRLRTENTVTSKKPESTEFQENIMQLPDLVTLCDKNRTDDNSKVTAVVLLNDKNRTDNNADICESQNEQVGNHDATTIEDYNAERTGDKMELCSPVVVSQTVKNIDMTVTSDVKSSVVNTEISVTLEDKADNSSIKRVNGRKKVKRNLKAEKKGKFISLKLDIPCNENEVDANGDKPKFDCTEHLVSGNMPEIRNTEKNLFVMNQKRKVKKNSKMHALSFRKVFGMRKATKKKNKKQNTIVDASNIRIENVPTALEYEEENAKVDSCESLKTKIESNDATPLACVDYNVSFENLTIPESTFVSRAKQKKIKRNQKKLSKNIKIINLKQRTKSIVEGNDKLLEQLNDDLTESKEKEYKTSEIQLQIRDDHIVVSNSNNQPGSETVCKSKECDIVEHKHKNVARRISQAKEETSSAGKVQLNSTDTSEKNVSYNEEMNVQCDDLKLNNEDCSDISTPNLKSKGSPLDLQGVRKSLRKRKKRDFADFEYL